MKGFTHFLSAIAVASCLPGAVQQAAQGSLVLVLAGAAGLLPDTLDFKLARYLKCACQSKSGSLSSLCHPAPIP